MPLNDEIIPLKIKFGIKSLARNANNGRVNNLEVINEFVSKPKAIFFQQRRPVASAASTSHGR